MTDGTKNLTPWQPGQSGNPNGRPKGSGSITAMLKKLMSEPTTITDEDGEEHTTSVAEAIAIRLTRMAMYGDVKATKEILDRTDGKLTELLSASLSSETIDVTPDSKITFEQAYELKYGKKPRRRKKSGSSKD